ncbi:metal tolerance protein B isoform X1 [Tanacetum coccineum]
MQMENHHHYEVEMPIANGGTDVQSKVPKGSCDCFFEQDHSVADAEQRSKATAKLCGLVIFYLIVMAVEVVGGLKANSLAILTDAAHLLTDIGGFLISLFTVWASGWKATPHQSFGFSRIEVLGALLSVQLIWIVSGYLFFEAIERILHKQSEVNGGLMFPIAAFGVVINVIMVIWLGHGHGHSQSHSNGHEHSHDTCVQKHHDIDEEEGTKLVTSLGHNHSNSREHAHGTCIVKHHDINEEEGTNLAVSTSKDKSGRMNINIEGAYLHVMADMIQSIGVMIAGLVIWVEPDWLIVDLVCTLIFSILALCTTLPMLRNIFSILMESTPSEVDVVHLKTALHSIKGLREVNDLHVWAITQGKYVLSCHILVDPNVDSNEILHRVKDLCEGTYGIHHVTAQIESSCL